MTQTFLHFTLTSVFVLALYDEYVLSSPLIVNHGSTGGSYVSAKCFDGPSYWCSSLQQAAMCNAVPHCIQTVWEHQQLPEDGDDICQICKKMVKEARDQLLSNETQEEIKEVFEGSCRLIPIAVISDECVRLADEFIPELIDTLASQMNPHIVCAVAGLCNSARIDAMLAGKTSILKPTVSDTCTDCRKFMKDVIHVLDVESESQVKEKCLEMCGVLSSLSDACRFLISDNFDQIYDVLKNHEQLMEVCDLSGMCDELFTRDPVKHPLGSIKSSHSSSSVREDLPCEFCEQMVRHLKDVLTANTTEEEFKMVLEGLCKQTGSFKDECLSLVDNYYYQIYNFITTEMNPKEVCVTIGICSSGLNKLSQGPIWILKPTDHLVLNSERLTGDDEREELPQTPLMVAEKLAGDDEVATSEWKTLIHAERITGNDESNAIRATNDLHHVKLVKEPIVIFDENEEATNRITSNLLAVTDKPFCVMCEYALHALQTYLMDHSTEEEIKADVEKLCDHLPKSVKRECDAFVDQYGDAIIVLLAQEIDPSQVCPKLGLCSRYPQTGNLLAPEGALKGDTTCVMCEYAISELEKVLKDNKSEEAVKKELDKLCTYLPQTVVNECQEFVDVYYDAIVDMVVNDFTPDEVCVALKLCKPTSTDVEMVDIDPDQAQLPPSRLLPQTIVNMESPLLTESGACVLCEFVMTELDNMLDNEATEDEIKRAVDFVCKKLPASITDQCIEFVNEYGDAIINLLIKVLDPKVVCSELQLCKQKLQQTPVESLHLDKCNTCKLVVQYIDKLLEDAHVEQKVDEVLEKVCKIVPPSRKEQCETIIETYGPYIMSVIGQIADSEEVCSDIHLCANVHGHIDLLGGKKCTWGPSYWCQSVEHANSCNALQHCQERVWKNGKE